MIKSKIWLYQIEDKSNGDYNVNMFFQNTSTAQYLRLNDEITDSAGNKYSIKEATLPFSDGATAKIHYISNNVQPIEDSDYNSVINSLDTFNPLPRLKTTGLLSDISIYDSINYEYIATFTPDDGATASEAIVGDRLVDYSGKEYEITYLSDNKFADQFRIKEVELQGISPSQDVITLYSQTKNFGFFQGHEFNPSARLSVQNRDFKKLDELLTQIDPTQTVDLFDILNTTLPTGADIIIDGEHVFNNMLVVFNSLVSGNSKTYKASNAGVNVIWTEVSEAVQDSKIFIKSGKVCNGLKFKYNDIYRKYISEDSGIFIAKASVSLRYGEPVYISNGNDGGDIGTVYLHDIYNKYRNHLAGLVCTHQSVYANEMVKIRASGIMQLPNSEPNGPCFNSPIWSMSGRALFGSEKPPFYTNMAIMLNNPMESQIGTVIVGDAINVNITNIPSHIKQFTNLIPSDDNTILFRPYYSNVTSIEYTCLISMMTLDSNPIMNSGKLVIVKEGSSYVSNYTFIGSDAGFKLDVDQTTGDIIYSAPTNSIERILSLRITGNDFEDVTLYAPYVRPPVV